NFREVLDWSDFRTTLAAQLAAIQPARKITNQRQLDQSCADLTNAIQNAIRDKVPVATITAKTKRWWTKELTLLRRNAEKLGRQSYKCRGDPMHKVHMEHKDAVKQYDKP
ncbi:hypothetical protein BC827DRAFT_1142319, partial [Russula dissimulans]